MKNFQVGDWVYKKDSNTPARVTSVFGNLKGEIAYLHLNLEDINVTLDEVEPIPLTLEILKREEVKHNTPSLDKPIMASIRKSHREKDYWVLTVCRDKNILLDAMIKYVHEFQHLTTTYGAVNIIDL